jgi:hypothetical protein
MIMPCRAAQTQAPRAALASSVQPTPTIRPLAVPTSIRNVRVFAAAPENDDARAAQLKAMQEAMSNPAVASQIKSMQEEVSKPEVQAEMQQMTQAFSNPAFAQRIAALREDPELKPLFDKIRSGGPMAMMQAMQDPEFLAKIGAKMGNLEEIVGGMPAGAPASAPPPPPPEVHNILDAAKYGDVEAIEDFLAVGKADDRDENKRSALHYSVAYDQGEAAGALLRGGADVNALDDKGNTPLHYASGYGRGAAVRALLAAGADVTVKNDEDQTAVDVILVEPRNPLNNDSELLEMLKSG